MQNAAVMLIASSMVIATYVTCGKVRKYGNDQSGSAAVTSYGMKRI